MYSRNTPILTTGLCPALTPSVVLASQYEAFPALPGPPHGRAGGQDRPVSGRAGARQRQAGCVRAAPDRTGQGRAGSKSTGQDREAPPSVGRRSVPDRAEQGRIQKNSKGRVMNRSGAPTYTQNSKTQQISTTLFRWPIFSFFLTWPVVPLLDRWCP